MLVFLPPGKWLKNRDLAAGENSLFFDCESLSWGGGSSRPQMMDYHWGELNWIETELNWIELNLNWTDLKLNRVKVELKCFELKSKLNRSECNCI